MPETAPSLSILLVDDDARFRASTAKGLELAGHTTQLAEDAAAARQTLDSGTSFDLILLDVNMPGENGFSLLGALREEGLRTPVLFVTARGTLEDRVLGLRLGADDFLPKPFEFEELLARIASVTRRWRAMPMVQRGPLQIDPHLRQARRNDRVLPLSPKEFDVLLALAESGTTPVSRNELLRRVWDITFEPGTNTVEVCIARLRKKLGKDGATVLQNAPGRGYFLST